MVWFVILGIFVALIVTYVLAITFPALAPQIGSIVDALVYYMGQAMGIVWLFVPQTITVTLMSLAIAVQVIVLGYKFVMWVLRKIPTAGIR